MNYVYIYSYNVTKDLLQKGYIIKDIKANPKYKNRTVFMFEDSEDIKRYLKNEWNIEFADV